MSILLFMAPEPYLERIADQTLQQVLRELPALMITGPRACGKTTSARRLAADALHLDDPVVAAAVAADPDAALRRSREPLLIDEWQEVPSVLGAVKRAVDSDSRPGRFLLTGSAEAEFSSALWPGTGRVIRVQMHGLTQREVTRSASGAGLLPHLISGHLSDI
ncbi:MAG: AAA family ATPase, partial [Angustibacter sp.]